LQIELKRTRNQKEQKTAQKSGLKKTQEENKNAGRTQKSDQHLH